MPLEMACDLMQHREAAIAIVETCWNSMGSISDWVFQDEVVPSLLHSTWRIHLSPFVPQLDKNLGSIQELGSHWFERCLTGATHHCWTRNQWKKSGRTGKCHEMLKWWPQTQWNMRPFTSMIFPSMPVQSSQWEFQDPTMEVLYHIRPYFVGIFPYIGLKHMPYIW